MHRDAHWWMTTIAGGVAAAAGGYAASDLPGQEVAASVAGLLGLLLGYFSPGRSTPPTRL